MAAVIRHGIPVNAGSLDMLERVGQQAPGHRVWLRINPGFGHGHSNKTNTGGPQSTASGSTTWLRPSPSCAATA